jgi:hypothetical protein
LQLPWNPGGSRGTEGMEEAAHKERNSRATPGRENLFRTDYPSGNNDFFILTRFFHSSDDSGNNFSLTSPQTGTEIMTSQAIPVTKTVWLCIPSFRWCPNSLCVES